MRRALLVLTLLACAPAAAAGQILPPIYKPLPVEEGERYRAVADSLRQAATDAAAQAEALEEGARTLRQNGSGVVERLSAEASRQADEASRLDAQARADALALDRLRAQRDDFAARADERDAEVSALRAQIEAVRAAPAPPPPSVEPADRRVDPAAPAAATAPSDPAWPIEPRTSLPAIDTLGIRAQIRADSTLAAAYRQQAADLQRQAGTLNTSIGSARQRAATLREQEAQLRGYAAEIASGRAANEPTAARLEVEAAGMRRTVERLTQESRTQAAQAEALRVQGDRFLLPVRNRMDAMRFYGEDGRSVLRTLVLSLGEGMRSGSLNSEVVSDYAGPVRFGVGFILADAREKAREDAEEEGGAQEEPGHPAALERFYAGGGNFVLYTALPLVFHRSTYHSFTVQTLSKVGVDVPRGSYRAPAGQVPTNLDIGFETYGTFNTHGGRVKAFGLLRSAYAMGNRPFYQNLGREERGAFPYSQVTAGAEIASLAKVLLSGAIAPSGVGREMAVTFQLAR